MYRLNNLLGDWVANNLITNEQAKKITAYENSKPSNSWVLYGFLILGAVIIGIGIISLVAANWKDIPNWLKLFVDFLLLVSLAGGSFSSWERKKPILFEVLLLSFMILCLASIGLSSQIYHTGGKLYQALLFWSIITAGVAAASKKALIPFFWISGFLSGLTFTALDSSVFQPNSIPVFMTIPLLSALLAVSCRRMAGECSQTKAFRSWTVISGMIALIIAESQVLNHKSHALGITAFMPGYVIAALLAIGIWNNHDYKPAQKTLLLATLCLYLIPFHLQLFTLQSDMAYAFFTLAVFASMAIFLASLKLRILFQFFLVAIGIRFLILYFQALGGLATTGFGLIISGLIIIFIVVVWNKYLKQITTWAEGLVK